MLSIAKCRDLDYYEREVIDGREDYLSESGTSPGQWVGSLAAADGYAGIAQRDHLARAFSGVHPDGFKMTAHDLTVPGFDMTLSPSKSVSLLWALGSDDDARSAEATPERPSNTAVGSLARYSCIAPADSATRASTSTGPSSTSPKALTVAAPRSTPATSTAFAIPPKPSFKRRSGVNWSSGAELCSMRSTATV